MSALAPVDIGTLITRSPGVKGNRPRVAGTGITVQHLVALLHEGLTAEQIAAEKELSLAQVHAALAYYYANIEALNSEFAEDEREFERLEAEWNQSRKQVLD